MEFINVIPSIITAVGGLIVALATKTLINHITALIDRVKL